MKHSTKVTNRICDFEDEVGISFVRWVRQKTAEGYGVPWMVKVSGVGYNVIQRIRKHHGIERTVNTIPAACHDNTIKGRLRAIGKEHLYWRTVKRMQKGMTFEQATEGLLCTPRT